MRRNHGQRRGQEAVLEARQQQGPGQVGVTGPPGRGQGSEVRGRVGSPGAAGGIGGAEGRSGFWGDCPGCPGARTVGSGRWPWLYVGARPEGRVFVLRPPGCFLRRLWLCRAAGAARRSLLSWGREESVERGKWPGGRPRGAGELLQGAWWPGPTRRA